MVLVNGSEGIGSGWKSAIPNYSPRELVECIRKKMRGERVRRLVPWFKNYEGRIVELGEGFACYGKYAIIDERTIEITELPVRKWTRDYKNYLEEITEGYEKLIAKTKDSTKNKRKEVVSSSKLKRKKLAHTPENTQQNNTTIINVEEPGINLKNARNRTKNDNTTNAKMKEDEQIEIRIEGMKEYHRGNSIKFVITLKPEYTKLLNSTESIKALKALKLTSSISKSQYVCFDSHNKLRRYDDADEIIDEYYEARLQLYKKRKAHQIESLKRELLTLENKTRFITEVITGQLPVFKQRKRALIDLLQSKGYAAASALKSKELPRDKLLAQLEECGEAGSTEFDYLLGMPLWSLTAEKVEELERQRTEKGKEMLELAGMSEVEMWERELREFVCALDEMEELERKAAEVSAGEEGEKSGKRAAGKKTSIKNVCTKRNSY
eukprot:TRINITY_DN4073_c0_g1_i6.p1 TRINITY_DN4073_c0_g1~~TRINITY_DN4073_c0_g1_i6.p1  ORF type:complete len:438 (-),score=156.44 TRINITY_DN4073_c0_g1_i6:112-1425(-)